jgi:hypothetical protein
MDPTNGSPKRKAIGYVSRRVSASFFFDVEHSDELRSESLFASRITCRPLRSRSGAFGDVVGWSVQIARRKPVFVRNGEHA